MTTIDLSWLMLLKVCVAGVLTYVAFPFALAVRDLIFWLLVNRYLLSNELRQQCLDLGKATVYYNRQLTGNAKMMGDHEGTRYEINGKAVDEETFHKYRKDRDRVVEDIRLLEERIRRRSAFFAALLKYFKQEEDNVIPNWVDTARADFESLLDENPSTKLSYKSPVTHSLVLVDSPPEVPERRDSRTS